MQKPTNNTLPKAEVLPRSLAEDVRGRFKPAYSVNDTSVSFALRHRIQIPVKVLNIR